jgi:hypothetical protein
MPALSGRAAMRTLLAAPLLFLLVLVACEDAGDTENRCRQGAAFRQNPVAYYEKCVECDGPGNVRAERDPSTQQLIGYHCK